MMATECQYEECPLCEAEVVATETSGLPPLTEALFVWGYCAPWVALIIFVVGVEW